jgi:hypothetical protein
MIIEGGAKMKREEVGRDKYNNNCNEQVIV